MRIDLPRITQEAAAKAVAHAMPDLIPADWHVEVVGVGGSFIHDDAGNVILWRLHGPAAFDVLAALIELRDATNEVTDAQWAALSEDET